MAGRQKAVFVCQITDTCIKVSRCVAASRPAKPSAHVCSVSVPASSPETAYAAALQEALKKAGYDRQELIISLPRHQATLRYLKLPTQDIREVSRIITLQAPRLIPYSPDELITGFEIVDSDASGYAGVAVTIVHKKIIERYLKFIQPLQPSKLSIVLSSYGLVNMYAALVSEPKAETPFILVEMDALQAEAVVCAKGSMRMSRSFKCPQDIKACEAGLPDEVSKTIQAYSDEYGGDKPSYALVFGPQEKASLLAAAISAKCGIPARVFDSKHALSFSVSSSSGLASAGLAFDALIGMGIRELPRTANLLPQEMKEEETAAGVSRDHLVKLAMLAAIFLICTAATGILVVNKQRYLASMQKEMGLLSGDVRPLEQAERRLQVLGTYSRNRFSSLDVLYALHQIVPEGIILQSLAYDDNRSIVLHGSAAQLQDVFAFVTAIQKSDVFKRFPAKVRYATKKRSVSGETVEFEIVCMRES